MCWQDQERLNATLRSGYAMVDREELTLEEVKVSAPVWSVLCQLGEWTQGVRNVPVLEAKR